MLVGRRFVLRGRVQGVGFRFFAERAARVEGLRGWVRNLDDGGVEVVAAGDQESVWRFEAKLRQGPPGARIDEVEVHDEVPADRASEFTIRT